MTTRRKSRESALQALFSIDMHDGQSGPWSDEEIERLDRMIEVPQASRDYFLELVKGVSRFLVDIDQCISDTSSNWKLSRMSAVDRNIIRIAVYEMRYRDDIPPAVAINEAIEVAKKFGTEKSGPFINGILDNLYIHFIRNGQAKDPQ